MFIRILCALAIILIPAPAHAIERTHATTSTIIAERDETNPNLWWIALHQKLDPHWHTYWETPGSTGLAITLTWNVPQNASIGRVGFPTPERITIGGLTTYGIEGEATYLTPITLPSTDTNSVIGLVAEWLVCRDICVPERASFEIDLTDQNDVRSDAAAIIKAARQEYRRDAITVTAATATATDLHIAFDTPRTPVDIFYRGHEIDPNQRPVFRRDGNIVIATLALANGQSFERFEGALVAFDDETGPKHVELREEGTEPGHLSNAAPSMWMLFIMAIAGGLLLNAMPCVFPILALKAYGMANAGADRARLRRQALLTGAGILSSFFLLTIGMLSVRNVTGGSGWGLQMQNPVVVTILVLLMTIISAHLFGWVRIGDTIGSIAADTPLGGGDQSAFLAGILSVALATPCIGPLMAAPMAAAFQLPVLAGTGLMMGIGLGLSLPYLLIATNPSIAKRFPKSGEWLGRTKPMLGAAMALSAVWLCWILSTLAGPIIAIATLLAPLVFIALQRVKMRLIQIAAGAGFAGLYAAAAIATPQVTTFVPPSYDSLKSGFRPTLVEVGAAWCLTCQANKRTLYAGSVEETLVETSTERVVLDWTRPNDGIAQFLRQAGREGVPLYVYFPGRGEAPIILPTSPSVADLLAVIGEGERG